MIIIGERINSTRTKIREAIKARNNSFIIKEADMQLKAGASFIDINCAVTDGDEALDIDWTVSVIQSEFKDVSICIDSPSYLAIDRALGTYKGTGEIIINSITAEEARMKYILPLVKKYNAKVIALTMDEKGMPETANQRVEIAKKIIARVKSEGIKPENVYFDPLIRPVSTEPRQAIEFLNAIPIIKVTTGAKTACGLSNVSFGLPKRSVINAAFAAMAAKAGLDAAIMDPLDKNVISSFYASNALLAEDEYCGEYIKAFRDGRLI